MIIGVPAFVVAVLLNYYLVEFFNMYKGLVYALVLTFQVTVNFFMVRYFVFKKRNQTSIWKQFYKFFLGIITFRFGDWLLYLFLVEVFLFNYIVIQLLNLFIFSIMKYKYSKKTIGQ